MRPLMMLTPRRAEGTRSWPSPQLVLPYAAGVVVLLFQFVLLRAHPLLVGGVGQDSVDLYAGALALRHGLDPYTAATAIGRRLTGIDPRIHPFAYADPPAFTVLALPLTWLSPTAAYRALCILNELGVALVALFACLGVRARSRTTMAVVFLALASGAGFLANWYGQVTPLLAVAAAGAFLLASRGRLEWAGALSMFLLLKPQLGAVALLVLFLAGGRRLRRGMLIGAVVLLAVTLLGGGFDAMLSFARTTLHDARGHERLHDIDTLALDGDLYQLFAAPLASALYGALIALTLCAAMWLAWLARRPEAPPAARRTMLAALMLLDSLVLPYSHQYDSALLLLPYSVAALSLAPGMARRIVLALCAAAALAPYLNLFHMRTQLRLLPLIDLATVIALCAVCVAASRRGVAARVSGAGSGPAALPLAG